MKTWIKPLVALLALVFLASFAWAQETKQDAEARIDQAATTLKELANLPDNGIPPKVMSQAKCVAIVPSIVKVGFIIGAKYGAGVATCKLPDGNWSAPAFFKLSGGSVGAQVGGTSTQLVLLAMDIEGVHQFYREQTKFGAEASATAGPVGKDVSTADEWKLNAPVLTYSRSKGAFAGVDLSGSSFSHDDDATTAYYGKNYSTRALLTAQPVEAGTAIPEGEHGKVHVTATAYDLLSAVKRTQQAAEAKIPAQPKPNNQ
jgi:SH3 domain-containing YSC84-like protein 1